METKNYITPGGLRSLQTELRSLRNDERPKLCETIAWAASNGDRSENGDYIYGKKRLREIDKRIRFLLKRIESAEVIDPSTIRALDVRFGATVLVRDEEDREYRYVIVGTDETSIEKGYISWVSPVARSLLRKTVGEIVEVHSPRGLRELEVLEIRYQSLEP